LHTPGELDKITVDLVNFHQVCGFWVGTMGPDNLQSLKYPNILKTMKAGLPQGKYGFTT
jgi:hypothetical protein